MSIMFLLFNEKIVKSFQSKKKFFLHFENIFFRKVKNKIFFDLLPPPLKRKLWDIPKYPKISLVV